MYIAILCSIIKLNNKSQESYWESLAFKAIKSKNLDICFP